MRVKNHMGKELKPKTPAIEKIRPNRSITVIVTNFMMMAGGDAEAVRKQAQLVQEKKGTVLSSTRKNNV